MIPSTHADILSTTALAHVATLGPKGEPQSTPVWFDYDGEHLRFSLTKHRQKYANLLSDPRIAISIVDPADPYRYLELRGTVARIDEDPDFAFIDSMALKYLGKEKYPWRRPGEERIVVLVKPTHFTKMG